MTSKEEREAKRLRRVLDRELKREAKLQQQQKEKERLKLEEQQRVSSWNIVNSTTGELRCTVTCTNIQLLYQLRGNNILGGMGDEVLREDADCKYSKGNYWYPVTDGLPSLRPKKRPYPDHLDPVKIAARRAKRRSERMENAEAKEKCVSDIVSTLKHLRDSGIDLGPNAEDLFN